MKVLTVKELMEELSCYHPDFLVVIHEDGNGHDHGIFSENMTIESDPYFADGDVDNELEEGERYLSISID